MPQVTIVFGGLLIALGIVCFAMTGSSHPTALIPTYVGAIMEMAGVLAMSKPNLRMHAMHLAVTVGLLGFIAGVGGMIARRPSGIALVEMIQLILLTGLFVAFCVFSFIAARRSRV